MKRQYCEHCAYPIQTCVCSAIRNVSLPIRIIIIQHHKESNHPKNTARLAKLVSPNIELIKVVDANTIKDCLKSLSLENSLLLFPSARSSAVESLIQPAHDGNDLAIKIDTLLFIDASWKQAYSIWHNNPILKTLVQGHFINSPFRNYRIRKSAKAHQLSTLEAIAYTLSLMCNIDTSAYIALFDKMQDNWEAYTPIHPPIDSA